MPVVEKSLGERCCLDCGIFLDRWHVALCDMCRKKRQRIYEESRHTDDLKLAKK